MPNPKPQTLHYLIVDKLSAPFQLVLDGQSNGGIITRIIEESAASAALELKQVVSSRQRNKLLKKTLDDPWITYSAKVWQPNLEHAHLIDVPLFEVRHSALTCSTNLQSVTRSEHLAGRNLAILESFDYPELAPLADQGALTLSEVSNYQQGFLLARHGRVDGFIEMTMRLQYNMQHMQTGIDAQADTSDCYRLVDLSHFIKPFPIYLIVSDKLSTANMQKLEQAVRALKSSGRIKRLLATYLSPARSTASSSSSDQDFTLSKEQGHNARSKL